MAEKFVETVETLVKFSEECYCMFWKSETKDGISVEDAKRLARAVHETIYQLEEVERELMHRAKGWYISVNDYGPEDNFVRHYTPLGFCSLEEAQKKCNELSEENAWRWDEDGVREVDKETYDAFCCLGTLESIMRSAQNNSHLSEIEHRDIFVSELELQISQLRKELGLKYHWESVWTR